MRLVLLGDPVSHSRSPAIHTAALGHFGIEGEYSARRVDEAGVALAVAELRRHSLDGANVTMPHKRLAGTLCDLLDDDAAAGGVVNTLAVRDGMVMGWNTDVTALRALASIAVGQGRVLVLGAGGAAAAAIVAFRDRDVVVSARQISAAEALRARFAGPAEVVPWGTVIPGALVVNATPIGMNEERLPEGIIEEASALIDLPYGVRATPACDEARRRRIPCVDGVDILVAQAGESFRIWTGLEPPVEVMRAVARD